MSGEASATFVDRMLLLARSLSGRSSPAFHAGLLDDEPPLEEPPLDAVGRRFALGMRRGIADPLGAPLWTLGRETTARYGYTAGAYIRPPGLQVGFLRIPSYPHDPNLIPGLAAIVRRLSASTDVLVLDQTYNPGGSVIQMYATLAHLVGARVPVPLHEVVLDEDDERDAEDVLGRAADAANLPPADRPTPELIVWSRFVLEHRRKGPGVLSDPTPLLGVSYVDPAPEPYTKPLFVLINESTASAAEMLAATLQDSRRGTLIGVRTMGAGGCVKSFRNSTISDIRYSLTWTVARRTNGEPIQDVGVHPDVALDVVEDDIMDDYAGFRTRLGAIIDQKTSSSR